MADVRVGGIYADVRARTSKFDSNIRGARGNLKKFSDTSRRARRDIRSFNRTARNTIRRLTSFKTIIGTVAGGSGLGLLVKSSADASANLVETGRATGLTVEQVQILGRVFKGEGVEVNRFNKIMERFRDSIGRARRDIGPVADAFRRFGIDPTQITSTQQALELLTQNMGNVGDEFERVSLLNVILGQNTGKFTAVLEKGLPALREASKQAARLGVTSEEAALKGKDLSQSFEDVGEVFSTASRNAIAGAADSFKRLNTAIADNAPRLIEGLIGFVAHLAENIDTLIIAAKALFVAMLAPKVLLAWRALATAMKVARTATLSLASAMTTLKRAVPFVGTFLALEGILSTLSGTLDDAKKSSDGLTDSFKTQGKAVLGLEDRYKALTKERRGVEFLKLLASENRELEKARDLRDQIESIRNAPEPEGGFFGLIASTAPNPTDTIARLEREEKEAFQRAADYRRRRLAINRANVEPPPTTPVGTPSPELEASTKEFARVEAFNNRIAAAGVKARISLAEDEVEAKTLLEEASRRAIEEREAFNKRVAALGAQARISLAEDEVNAQIEAKKKADEEQRYIDEQYREWVLEGQDKILAGYKKFQDDQTRIAKEAAEKRRLEMEKARLAQEEVDNDLIASADRTRQFAGAAFRDLFKGATTGADGFKNALRGIAQRLVDVATEALIVQPLIQGLFGQSGGKLGGLVGGFLGSLFGGGGEPLGGTAGLGSLRGYFSAQTGGLHQGFGIVGEDGPELVDFRNPSRVYTNDNLAAAIGSQGPPVVVNQNYTFNGVEEAGLRSVAEEIGLATEAAVMSKIQTNLQRPSGLRRAASGR